MLERVGALKVSTSDVQFKKGAKVSNYNVRSFIVYQLIVIQICFFTNQNIRSFIASFDVG